MGSFAAASCNRRQKPAGCISVLASQAFVAGAALYQPRLCHRDGELFDVKDSLMSQSVQCRALQEDLQQARGAYGGARCSLEKLQHELCQRDDELFNVKDSLMSQSVQCRALQEHESEDLRQQLQLLETKNDELAVVAALEASKQQLEQQSGAPTVASPCRPIPFRAGWAEDVAAAARSDDAMPSREPDPELLVTPSSTRSCAQGKPAETLSLFCEACDDSSPFLQGVLDCLSVSEITCWRVTSRQAWDAKALVLHLAEWGSLSRQAAMSKYSEISQEGQKFVRSQPDDQKREAGEKFLSMRCAGDPMLEKVFRSQSWYMLQSFAGRASFPEHAVREMNRALVRDLLLHFHSSDSDVCCSSFFLIACFAEKFMPRVQEALGFGLLGVLDLLLLSPKEQWWRKVAILKVLTWIAPSLGVAQRTRWVDVLTKLLKQEDEREKQELIISKIEIFYLADADPTRTFANVDLQLEEIQRSRSTPEAVCKALFSMRFPWGQL